jgi:formamidopyrimidine-DNA glycosylase
VPELPEVQTTVDGLNAEVAGLRITDVWTDYKSPFHAGKENIKNPHYFERFKKEVVGTKITNAERQGKNVLIHLKNVVGEKTILIHMKMTGHLMAGRYIFDTAAKTWKPRVAEGPLIDPFNKFIHLVFALSDERQLVFSDLRKFAKVFLFETANRHTIEDLMHLGPDPLTPEFTFAEMKNRLALKPGGKIKQVLMDQTVISGIGNIYSDEMLWSASIHPLSRAGAIPPAALKKLYAAMRTVLRKGIDFGGDSDSDYRNIYGERGKFQHKHNAYRRTDKPCPRRNAGRACGGTIRRLKIGGRSAHFCDTHQKKYL